MQVLGVLPLDPRTERELQFDGACPLTEPEEFLIEGPHESFLIRVYLRIVVAGEGLRDAEGRRGCHEGDAGRLTAVITHDVKPLVSAASEELPLHHPIQYGGLVVGLRLEARIVADDFLVVPVQHHDQVHPASGVEQHLGHINAPSLVRGLRTSPASRRRPRGLQPLVALHQQAVLVNQP